MVKAKIADYEDASFLLLARVSLEGACYSHAPFFIDGGGVHSHAEPLRECPRTVSRRECIMVLGKVLVGLPSHPSTDQSPETSFPQ